MGLATGATGAGGSRFLARFVGLLRIEALELAETAQKADCQLVC